MVVLDEVSHVHMAVKYGLNGSAIETSVPLTAVYWGQQQINSALPTQCETNHELRDMPFRGMKTIVNGM
jgi:hypothetical protein